MDKFPDIALSYDERISSEIFDEFESSLGNTGLSLIKEPREHGPYMGLELLLPTAVILYVGKAYFESFLKEMGKDHYQLMKKGLQSFRKSFLSKTTGIKYQRVAVPASKIPEDPIFSVLFSIMAKTKNGQSIKFLFPEYISEEEFQKSTEAFFQLLNNNYSAEKDDELTIQFQSFNTPQHTFFVRYDVVNQKPEVIDPMAEIKKKANNRSIK